MKLTKMDMAKVVATALYNLPELVTEKNTVAWRYAKKLTRSSKENVESLYKIARKILDEKHLSEVPKPKIKYIDIVFRGEDGKVIEGENISLRASGEIPDRRGAIRKVKEGLEALGYKDRWSKL